MVSLMTSKKAQERIATHMRSQRLAKGLTQQGLSERSGVPLASLRKFEQKGAISLESFLKLAITLGCIEKLLEATELQNKGFSSIDEVIHKKTDKSPQRGWRK